MSVRVEHEQGSKWMKYPALAVDLFSVICFAFVPFSSCFQCLIQLSVSD